MDALRVAKSNSGAAAITPGEISATSTSLIDVKLPSSPAVEPTPQPITNARSAFSASRAGTTANRAVVPESPRVSPSLLPWVAISRERVPSSQRYSRTTTLAVGSSVAKRMVGANRLLKGRTKCWAPA